MMEKGKSEMEEEKKSWPGSFNLIQLVWKVVYSLKEFREIWEFWGVVRIWDLNQVVILMSIGLVFMKRWTQSWVSPIDTTWGMQSMRSSRRLGWKKQSEGCQLFCLPMQWDDFKILYVLCALLHVAGAKSVNSNRLKLKLTEALVF